MNTVILFGTESGNAEFVAGNIADGLTAAPTKVADLAEFPVSEFSKENVYLVVCSTYGSGDPPASAKPFLVALDHEKPDLSGIRYAIFGLGDSSYADSYSHGSEVVSDRLTKYGATRFGEYGRHDASGLDDASDLAVQWAETVMRAIDP